MLATTFVVTGGVATGCGRPGESAIGSGTTANGASGSGEVTSDRAAGGGATVLFEVVAGGGVVPAIIVPPRGMFGITLERNHLTRPQ